MENNTDDPGVVLNSARKAFQAGDYAEALELYQWFFEHALDNDPASFYGVRLSYCLYEWSDLGDVYPKAKEQLKLRKEKSLNLLDETKKASFFHEYISICESLDCIDEIIPRFLEYHLKDKKLAGKIIGYLWHDLVVAGKWRVCEYYLNDSDEKYTRVMAKFDEAMDICKSDPSLGGEEFEQQIKGWYIRDVSDLLLVLRNNDREPEAEILNDKMKLDMKHRGYHDIPVLIYKKMAR